MWRNLKPIIYFLCLLPLIYLFVQGIMGNLGVNPIETLVRFLGFWALNFILIGLGLSVTSRLTGYGIFNRWRRIIGLTAFGYVFLHLLTWLGLDQGFYWSGILEDIGKRIYILLGILGFTLLIPLAVTSTDKMMRRLTYVRWKKLHWLIYPAAILMVWHYILLAKVDFTTPIIYAAILAVLLGIRLWWWGKKRISS